MTAGARLYQIRLACGDGVRKAETLDDFSARVKKKTGRHYDPATLSLLERDKQQWKLADAQLLAEVDPLKRGAVWLAFGVIAKDLIDPARDRKLTEDELERATQVSDEQKARLPRRRPKGA